MEFHISRQARDKYKFDQTLFSYAGNAILANFHAARVLAQTINSKLDLVNFPEQAIKSGQINELGLIDEILHHVVHLYKDNKNLKVLAQALAHLDRELGKDVIDNLLLQFTGEFPPLAVFNHEISAEKYLKGTTAGTPNRQTTLEEMIMLWVTNQNPATLPYSELFNDSNLLKNTQYIHVVQILQNFFDFQPKFGPDQQNLLDMLRAPAIAVPYSLSGQLEFIRQRWSTLLGKYLYRLLSSLDFVREEEKLVFQGPGPTVIPVYNTLRNLHGESEPENFSQDREWMPQLVLIAKNTYVWLDQLSKKYHSSITRLDQIPDTELDLLVSRGFTGLWLIGLWERSKASAKIKQLCGNPDAISSAYSLFSYNIASDLGGDLSYQNLHQRCWQRGIRLASDMVPNHMGIDSPWVIEHPEWFLQVDTLPYPSHSFNGPNLSNNPNVGIYIEDHYFDRSDAAVEFKRIDYNSSHTRYIYHGNDGTSMPWNDTAQLDYLNPQVREAIIQTILEVARKFSVIRFDAAMTLTKKHFQRLWFPEPGTGGAIPTRSEHGMNKAQFDQIMPNEFWREVVDRVAAEAPDTLLLAEAFWLMEGYFVRTLGMHRVYNSAFMNMLRNEDNAGYRQLIKNTLEFDPEILKRYVNFMNNPDERTAVDQFGKGDKYFGICTLMSTLPGLPMFGHGQVEGFSEKYGMEFKRPLWDESEDPYLVDRHNHQIFPLLHRRAVFAGVDNFLLYDFETPFGADENVYAFTNQLGSDRTLVVYNNKFSTTSGTINSSSSTAVKTSGGKRKLIRKNLASALNLNPSHGYFTIFRDQCSGLEFIYPTTTLMREGLSLEMTAYQVHVFLDFREVFDDSSHSYAQLCSTLNGRGVPNIEEAIKELVLAPVQRPFREIFNPGYLNYLLDNRIKTSPFLVSTKLLSEVRRKEKQLLAGISNFTGIDHEFSPIVKNTASAIEIILNLGVLGKRYPLPGSKPYAALLKSNKIGLSSQSHWLALLSWAFIHDLGKISKDSDPENQTISWLEEWQLSKIMSGAVKSMGSDDSEIQRILQTINFLITQQHWFTRLADTKLKAMLQSWLSDEHIQAYLGINRYQDILWYNKESFEEFVWWMKILALLEISSEKNVSTNRVIERLLEVDSVTKKLLLAQKKSKYQISLLLDSLKK
jgi:glycosidase